MFSFASNNLRASKHGNFSSVDSWSSSERMFAEDGYNERWYQASECTYNAVVEMNHPEIHSKDNTGSKSAVYTAGTSISLQITFSSTMTVHTDLNVARDHNVAFISLLLPFGGNFYVYIDVILEEIFSPFITNSKLSTVISDAPFFRNSIIQSINPCSDEPHFVA